MPWLELQLHSQMRTVEEYGSRLIPEAPSSLCTASVIYSENVPHMVSWSAVLGVMLTYIEEDNGKVDNDIAILKLILRLWLIFWFVVNTTLASCSAFLQNCMNCMTVDACNGMYTRLKMHTLYYFGDILLLFHSFLDRFGTTMLGIIWR